MEEIFSDGTTSSVTLTIAGYAGGRRSVTAPVWASPDARGARAYAQKWAALGLGLFRGIGFGVDEIRTVLIK